MPSNFLKNALRFTQAKTLATFGGAEKIWWLATAGLSTYTVPIACAASPVKQDNKELAGLLTLPGDAQSFHCTLADFPFPPRPEMVFVFGPDNGSGTYDPAASRKFLINTAAAFGEHITLTATDHGPAA